MEKKYLTVEEFIASYQNDVLGKITDESNNINLDMRTLYRQIFCEMMVSGDSILSSSNLHAIVLSCSSTKKNDNSIVKTSLQEIVVYNDIISGEHNGIIYQGSRGIFRERELNSDGVILAKVDSVIYKEKDYKINFTVGIEEKIQGTIKHLNTT